MQTHSEPAMTLNPVVTTLDLDSTTDLEGTKSLASMAKPPPEASAREAPPQPQPRDRSPMDRSPSVAGARAGLPLVTGVQERPAPRSTPGSQQPRLPVAPGRVLQDRYVLTQLVGTGGMCVVYRARDLEATDKNHKPAFVALKTPRPDLPDPSRAIARLLREYAHAQDLSHASIVQVFDLDCDGDVWFMTMEMLEGESLASIMRRITAPLPPHLTRRALLSTAEALAYSHWVGVVHGDLSPANIFAEKSDRIKVLDFGAACSAEQPASASATPAYSSPQVLEGAIPTIRDDIFSFGCIAYEALTGRHPFGHRPSHIARSDGMHVDMPLDMLAVHANALRAALAWERDARPDDIKELARLLAPQTARRRTSFVLEPEEDLEPPTKGDDKHWWVLGGVCFVAMIVAVVVTRFG